MTVDHGKSDESSPDGPARKVFEDHVTRWVDLFNRGDHDAMDRIYEDRGVLVPEPGRPVTGPDRAAANAQTVGLGVPMEARLRHYYVADDIALLIIDWSVEGTGPDGARVALTGTSSDVLRRDRNGDWRVVIDNPSGTA